MVQIIGLLICACLAVKLLEMSGNSSLHGEDGEPRTVINVAIAFGWFAVFGFAFWLLVQGDAFPSRNVSASDLPGEITLSDAEIECISRSTTADETLACTQ